METSDIVSFAVLIVLIALSAVFSAAETALTAVNKLRIKTLAQEGNKRAIVLEKVLSKQPKMLSAILICNNLINISASSIATILATKFFGSAGAGIATGIITVLILVFGEISPKTIATIHAEKLSLKLGNIIWFLMQVLTPVIIVVNFLARAFMRILGIKKDHKELAYTEGELRTIIDVSHEEGVIESDEKEMINNVIDFGDAVAKDIMIPRIDVTFVRADSDFDDLMNIFQENMYTRYPVYEEDTDHIVGILNMKDVLLYDRSKAFFMKDYIRTPHFTYETKDISDLLMEMRAASVPITVVLDEYGATAGLITMEDILEEIVGEIRDEYDKDEVNVIRQLSENEYCIEAQTKLDDINDRLEWELVSEEYDSLGGLVIEHLGHLPSTGEIAYYKNLELCVEEMDGNRIEVVHVRVLPAEEIEKTEENEVHSADF